MRTVLFAIMLISSALNAQDAMEPYTLEPCDKIRIESYEPIDLTKAEKGLVCGDKDNPAWTEIPLGQAQYFLKVFLESRGYWQLRFIPSPDKIFVKTGRMLTLISIEVVGSPIEVPVENYWYPLGRPLTPTLLDAIEVWLKQYLADHGYPCAVVKAVASQVDAKVRLTVDAGEKWEIAEIKSNGIPGLIGNAERRYDAFSIGGTYNAKLFELTSRRLISNGLVLSSSFTPLCGEKKPGIVEQKLVVGAPRLLSFGLGFDTEEYAVGKFLWQNGRLLTSGSPLTLQASASYRLQSAAANWDWYYLPFASSHFLALFANVQRKNEARYEEVSTKASAAPAWQKDVSWAQYRVTVGPAFQLIESRRGISKETVSLASFDTNLTLTSHDFEFYSASPRAGHQIGLSHSATDKDLGSNVSVSTWKLRTTHLWNAGGWEPPIFVLGLRSELATIQAGKETEKEDLPASFRMHLGGEQNLRGFGRNALPPDDVGAMTFGYLGGEFRLNNIVAYNLQPLLFVDGAYLGEKSLHLDRENLYWSPGFGIRWESPIGALRFTLGHGVIRGSRSEEWEYLTRWQFYFSFGGQF